MLNDCNCKFEATHVRQYTIPAKNVKNASGNAMPLSDNEEDNKRRSSGEVVSNNPGAETSRSLRSRYLQEFPSSPSPFPTNCTWRFLPP